MIRSVFMQATQAVDKMNEVILKNARWGSITIKQKESKVPREISEV